MELSERETNIMTIIYNKINQVIGAGNQLFTMQFPAQPLNPKLYRYNTDDHNSVLTKPYSVAEQEFRLSDQLFDISPITAGSNGERLSVVYDTAINNMIPNIDHLAPFIKDRAGLCHWLLEPSGEKVGDNELSRIELCKKLYEEYLVAKNAWNETKNKKFDSLKGKEGGLDEYAKWQSSVGLVETEKLNNLYNDVVISGHLHEVLTILGYLNASSIAEELELSKQKMRNSARLSLDESLTVYPVQLSPNNWFEALSPNLNPEDLTMSKDSIRDIYLDKQKELSRLKGDLQKAELMSTTPEDVAKAQKEVDDAKKAVNDAETELVKDFGEGIVGVAKIYFQIAGGGTINVAKALEAGAEPNPSAAYMDALTKAVKGISETQQKQQALTTAIGNLSSSLAKKAEIESKDWTLNKETMRQRVNELEVDVNYYADLFAGIAKINNRQDRVQAKRMSFVEKDKKLVYQLFISNSITGGSFTIKLDPRDGKPENVKTTAEISVAVVAAVPGSNDASGTPASIDTNAMVTNIQTAIVAKWENSTTTVLVNSPGYFVVTFADINNEPDLIIDQTTLQPTVEVSEPNLLPKALTIADAELQGMFTDVVISIKDSADSSSSSAASQARASSWGVSLWFASASGSSSQSSARSDQRSSFFNEEIDVAFRVAKVSFDRGGWFSPNIFKMSSEFSRLANLQVSPGLTVDNVKEIVKSAATEDSVQTAISKLVKDENGNYYTLPAFPVAMAIVKDVTIRIKKSKMTSQASKDVAEQASAASGGFLCFSVSSSSSSKNSSESSMHGSHGEYYYIRIPGPQVLGYFMQMIAKDNTTTFKPELAEDGTSPVLDALKFYNSAPELLKISTKPTLDNK